MRNNMAKLEGLGACPGWGKPAGGGRMAPPLPQNKSLLVCTRKPVECGYKLGLITDAFLDKLQCACIFKIALKLSEVDKSCLQYLFCQVTVLNAADYWYIFSIIDHCNDHCIISLHCKQMNMTLYLSH